MKPDSISMGERLKSADSCDLQLIKLDEDCGDSTWAVSLYGCYDFAWFLRKADGERFIKQFGERAMMKGVK